MADDPGMGLTQVRLLIIRSQRGDPAAFRQLVERFDRRLLYFITSLINDPEQAFDVSQETWLSVFRQLPNLSSPSAFRTWVYRIAHGKSIELLRRQKRFPGTGESPELLDCAIADSDLIQLENVELVHTALSRLALHHREVLSLHFMESMSIEEMTQVLGCPPGTVKSRLHYARAAMRKTIEELTRD